MSSDLQASAIDWDAVEKRQQQSADIYRQATGRIEQPLLVRDWRYQWDKRRREGFTKHEVWTDLAVTYAGRTSEQQADGVATGITDLRAGSLTWDMVQQLLDEFWSEDE